MMDHKELIQLIKLLKRHGVTEYSHQGLTLRLDGKSSPRGYKSATEALQGKPQYNEDETLFWSTPGIPDEKTNS